MGQLWENMSRTQSSRIREKKGHRDTGKRARGAEEHGDSAGRYSEGQKDRQGNQWGEVGAWGWIG